MIITQTDARCRSAWDLERAVARSPLLWPALSSVLAKSVRSDFDWKSALNHFAILFGACIALHPCPSWS
jgi:hypothetical protein